jgi:hypothetical protein
MSSEFIIYLSDLNKLYSSTNKYLLMNIMYQVIPAYSFFRIRFFKQRLSQVLVFILGQYLAKA